MHGFSSDFDYDKSRIHAREVFLSVASSLVSSPLRSPRLSSEVDKRKKKILRLATYAMKSAHIARKMKLARSENSVASSSHSAAPSTSKYEMIALRMSPNTSTGGSSPPCCCCCCCPSPPFPSPAPLPEAECAGRMPSVLKSDAGTVAVDRKEKRNPMPVMYPRICPGGVQRRDGERAREGGREGGKKRTRGEEKSDCFWLFVRPSPSYS